MISISIFEDNKHLREGLQFLLNNTEGYRCVGAYPDCRNLLLHLTQSPPDVVLMDIEMPGMSGIEATQVIKENFPAIQVLIQTVFFDDDYIFRAICAGASGYILKSATPTAYLEALADVKAGGSPMTPGIARRVVELFRNHVHLPDANRYALTEKEKEVLAEQVAGKSYKMIAGSLSVSVDTVKTHVKNIYAKLQVHSGTEAVSKAIREKIV